MSRRKKKIEEPKVIYHQENPPPGRLTACGRVVDHPKNGGHFLVLDRDVVNYSDCLSRPDPTIIVR